MAKGIYPKTCAHCGDEFSGSRAQSACSLKCAVFSRVSFGHVDNCWEWTGTKDKDGYGKFMFNGKNLRAHRTMYEAAVGDIGAGLVVMHSCDNPACCNPLHLSTGTLADNVADMDAKGRRRDQSGTLNPQSKLTPCDVIEIRRRHSLGESQSRIAETYGVDQTNVSSICRFNTWADVDNHEGAS